MLWAAGLAIVLLWFLAGAIGALVKSVKMRLRVFMSLCALSAVVVSYYLLFAF
jgi:hypothetical protein